jgi:hypothetical protein
MPLQSTVLLWTLFVFGQSLHILKRAGMAVRSKTNSIRSRVEFVAFCWEALLVRLVLCSGLFAALQTNPHGLTKLLTLIGVQISAEIPVDPGTALIFGYFADSVLDWLVSKIPVLQKELPTWTEPNPPTP